MNLYAFPSQNFTRGLYRGRFNSVLWYDTVLNVEVYLTDELTGEESGSFSMDNAERMEVLT